MKLERSIRVDAGEDLVRERAAVYFALAKYRQAVSQPHLLSFQRGTFPPWSPDKWNVNAVIQTEPASGQATQADIRFDIDTSGQFVIESERRFWRNELDDLERFMRTGKLDDAARARENRSLLRRSKVVSLVTLGLIALLVIAVLAAVLLIGK